MIVSNKKDAISFENSPTCKGLSFVGSGDDIDGAIITVNGCYPRSGFLMNEVSKELVYIIKGLGSLISKAGNQMFETGDVIFIDKAELFAWEGDFEGFFVTTPRFDPAQHNEVPG